MQNLGCTCKTAIAVIIILKLWFSKVASYLLLREEKGTEEEG